VARLLQAILRAVGVSLYRLGLHGIVIRLRRGSPRVLAYHACQEEEDDAIRGLRANTPPEHLERHLDFLLRHYAVVPLDAVERGSAPPKAAVVTFDDGYVSLYRHALPLLAARRIPAVVYLPAAVIGSDRTIWVNELNWLLHRHAAVVVPRAAAALGLDPASTPRTILDRAVETYDPARVESLLASLWAALPAGAERPPRLHLDWDEVRRMHEAGIAFGNHTMSHPNLRRLDPQAQRDEMDAAARRIGEEVEPPSSLAYPFGLYTRESAGAAAATGHRSTVTVGGATVRRECLQIGRVPVTARNDAELFAELEIIAPARALLRRVVRGDG
jgi:peptidoglycan/xylan/chitin deacetylase (PgdA/CDA1 family)